MDKVIIPNWLDDPQNILEVVDSSIKESWWYRYKNPFESKWALDKQKYDDAKLNQQVAEGAFYIQDPLLFQVMLNLAHSSTCWWVSRLLGVPIEYGDINHYGGVFVYDKGDYLKSHVDAGRHPKSKQVKVATACLYLTPAQIIFWKGEPAFLDAPIITQLDEVINIPANSCLFFLNHDQAYHEVPLVTSNKDKRVCITVSYIAPEGFKDPRFINDRTRAYFARHMSHPDSPELAELRQLRASEEHHHTVYRI